MYEAATRNLRTTERFLIDPPLSAQFGAEVVSVCDISVKGARFLHGRPLEMGSKAMLRLAVNGKPSPVSLEAVVVWTQPDTARTGRFVSGVRTYPPAEVIDRLLHDLQAARRTTRIEELRASDRFTVQPALEGLWDRMQVFIEDLSAHGARIACERSLEAGRRGLLKFALPGGQLTVEVEASIAWSSLKSVDPPHYRAGVAIAGFA